MSKNIAISDEVYERLSSEKDGKSFSEIIKDKISSGSRIEEVAGRKILERETIEKVREDIEKGSAGSMERLDDEVA